MHYRKFGDLGLQISEVGFGAWQLGNRTDWSPMSEDDAIQLVHTALDTGCNFFDTAPGYGSGESERLLGIALQGKREHVIINTKVGHNAKGENDWTPDGLYRSVEESLQRLQTDYLDTAILHNPDTSCLYGDSPQMKALSRMREEGLIHGYGASVDSAKEMQIVLETSDSHVMEVLFNIFHQETSQMFAAAADRQVGLIIKVPLDSGWLSGKYTKDSQFGGVRARWNTEVVARRAKLVDKIRFIVDDSTTFAQAALRFILGHSEVTTVIPGPKSVAQWRENASASDEDMPKETLQKLQQFWREELQTNPLPW